MDTKLEQHIDMIMVGLLNAVDYVTEGDLPMMRDEIGKGLLAYRDACGGKKPNTGDSGLHLQRVSISVCPSCGGSPIEENGASKHCPYCDFYF